MNRFEDSAYRRDYLARDTAGALNKPAVELPPRRTVDGRMFADLSPDEQAREEAKVYDASGWDQVTQNQNRMGTR